jgi:hypothetical protein
MSELRFHFDGPFTFTEGTNSVFSSCYAHSPGIYLWTIRQLRDNSHLVHYVGETAQFGKRHREHLINILGLNYGIFDPDDAQAGVCTVLWKGLWREKNIEATTRAVNEYQRLQNQVLRYVNSITIFFAELSVESQLRKHIEGCIGCNVRDNHPECKQLYPHDNRVCAQIEKAHGRLLLSAAEEIRGFEDVIAY